LAQSYFGPVALASLVLAGLRLDRRAYARVAAEPAATHHCLGVTVLAAISQAALVAPRSHDPLTPVVVAAIAFALIGLAVRAALLWGVGAMGLAHGRLTLGAALRPLGLAAAPEIFYVVGAILETAGPRGTWASTSVLDPLLGLWALAASVVAIRSALRGGLGAAILLALLFRLGEREVGLLLAPR
jgi:hypothetical protein